MSMPVTAVVIIALALVVAVVVLLGIIVYGNLA